MKTPRLSRRLLILGVLCVSVFLCGAISFLTELEQYDKDRRLFMATGTMDYKSALDLIRQGADPNTNFGAPSLFRRMLLILFRQQQTQGQQCHISAFSLLTSNLDHEVVQSGRNFADLNNMDSQVLRAFVLTTSHHAMDKGDASRALRFASLFGQVDVMRSLVRFGASVNELDCWHQTALHYAANVNTARNLIEWGACVDIPDNRGWTPLMFAVTNCDGGRVKLLLDRGANPNKRDYLERTPLIYASMYASDTILRDLINRHACVDDRDVAGRTALMSAAAGTRIDLVRCLLRNNADRHIKDKYGWNAVMYARASRSRAILKLLRD